MNHSIVLEGLAAGLTTPEQEDDDARVMRYREMAANPYEGTSLARSWQRGYSLGLTLREVADAHAPAVEADVVDAEAIGA